MWKREKEMHEGGMTRKRVMEVVTMQGKLFPWITLKIQKKKIHQIQNYFKYF